MLTCLLKAPCSNRTTMTQAVICHHELLIPLVLWNAWRLISSVLVTVITCLRAHLQTTQTPAVARDILSPACACVHTHDSKRKHPTGAQMSADLLSFFSVSNQTRSQSPPSLSTPKHVHPLLEPNCSQTAPRSTLLRSSQTCTWKPNLVCA